MIINREAKYLYVEPPFTGSTAISHELCDFYGGERVLWKHAKLFEADPVLGDEADDYFIFASVRNPLDQAVSEYLKLKNDHMGYFTNEKLFARNGGYITDRTLEEFAWVQETGATFDQYFQKFKNKLFHNWYLLGSERIDHLIEFEDLAGGFATVLEKIGLEPARALPVRNKTEGKKHYADYYPPHTWAQAFRCYGPFMREWGYEFPAHWDVHPIPALVTARYRAIDKAVAGVTRHVRLDSTSGVVQQIKRLAQGG